MLTNPTRIRPSQLLLTPYPPRFGGHIRFSRPVLRLQRPGFITATASLLSSHQQNPKTSTAICQKKINITSTQERRRSSYGNSTAAASTTNNAAVEDVEDLSKNGNKKDDEELKLDFIKKVYYQLAAHFLFSGLVFAALKMTAGSHSPNPVIAFYGSSDLLFFLGTVYAIFDSKWKSTNSFTLGLYSLATIVLLGKDLANLNGKAMVAAGTATLAIFAFLTKLTFWEPEMKSKASKYLQILAIISVLFEIIYLGIQICTRSPISLAVVYGMRIIFDSWYLLDQSEKLVKASDNGKDGGFNYDEYPVASVQLFTFMAHLFWSIMMTLRELQPFMV